MRWRQCKKVKLECCIALQVKGGGPTKGRALWLAQKGSGQSVAPMARCPSQGLRKGVISIACQGSGSVDEQPRSTTSPATIRPDAYKESHVFFFLNQWDYHY